MKPRVSHASGLQHRRGHICIYPARGTGAASTARRTLALVGAARGVSQEGEGAAEGVGGWW
eukprot:scaffold41350_cov62-Phaeocystis_antarctica.AAC.2